MGKENKHREAFAKFPPSPITKGVICSGLSQLRAHQPRAITRLVPCRDAELVCQREGRGSSVGAAGNAEQVGEASLDMIPGFGSTAGRCWVSLRWQRHFVWQEACVQVGSEPCLTCCVFNLGKLKQEHTLIRTAINKLARTNNLNTTALQQSPPTPCTVVCQKFGFFFFFLSGDDKTGYVNIK